MRLKPYLKILIVGGRLLSFISVKHFAAQRQLVNHGLRTWMYERSMTWTQSDRAHSHRRSSRPHTVIKSCNNMQNKVSDRIVIRIWSRRNLDGGKSYFRIPHQPYSTDPEPSHSRQPIFDAHHNSRTVTALNQSTAIVSTCTCLPYPCLPVKDSEVEFRVVNPP